MPYRPATNWRVIDRMPPALRSSLRPTLAVSFPATSCEKGNEHTDRNGGADCCKRIVLDAFFAAFNRPDPGFVQLARYRNEADLYVGRTRRRSPLPETSRSTEEAEYSRNSRSADSATSEGCVRFESRSSPGRGAGQRSLPSGVQERRTSGDEEIATKFPLPCTAK